ncbi:hypothetical protein EGW08_007994 [Elysia chlorotica]|uniref:Uncharacterized protein n=1 Tax=Elysia chlorotica TaxID=188477 RepID=A0A3S1A6X9_ELYCH|nr:hypothetical protein EGW08_007994 [Elysia chlorotica]
MERCYCCQNQHQMSKDAVPSWSKGGQLSLAIQTCNKMWVQSLLSVPDQDFDIKKGNYICQASDKGDKDIMLELLAAGADPNEESSVCAKRPVHICAENGHLGAMEVLVRYGADINQLDAHKRTVMHFASQQGHGHSIEWLIDHGALADEIEMDGYSPLHVATCLGYKTACRSLLTLGKAEVNRLSKDSWSSLHMAASYGHPEIVKMLLSFGASHAQKTAEGETALHMACAKGFIDICQVLLDHGTHIESCNIHGATPLHYAVYYGHIQVVYRLLKSGASVNFLHLPAISCPVNISAMRGDQDMLDLLQCAGCVVRQDTAALLYQRKNISAQYRNSISRSPSLRDLCIWKVRLVLAPDLQNKTIFLPLPRVVKDVIMLHRLVIR